MLSPDPLGFIALSLAPAEGSKNRAGLRRSPPGLCCLQAPDRRSGCVPAEPYPPLEQSAVFPVSVSLGVYRAGNGKRGLEFELVAAVVVANEFALVGEFGQGGADGGGAQAAELAQLLNGDGFLELGQGATNPMSHRRGWRVRLASGGGQPAKARAGPG